ncbi:MAG: hypothetical protein IJO61_04130 [Oscillospiraceae bacterium]|nr:hypothetical protein [Oscillospiraceae bacterium]
MKRFVSILLCVLMVSLSACGDAKYSQRESLESKGIHDEGASGGIKQLGISDEFRNILDQALIMLAGSNVAYVCGERTDSNIIPPEQYDGNTYISAEMVVESFGGSYSWDSESNVASLTLDGKVSTLEPIGGNYMSGKNLMVPADAIPFPLEKDVKVSGGLVIVGDRVNAHIEKMSEDDYKILEAAIKCDLQADIRDEQLIDFDGYPYKIDPNRILEYTLDPSDAPFKSPAEVFVVSTGGLHIENLEIIPIDNKPGDYKFSMDIYNTSVLYGSFEVYDKDHKLQKTRKIEPAPMLDSSIIDAVFVDISNYSKDFTKFVKTGNWAYLYEKNKYDSTLTSVEVEVPAGGYIRITNNIAMSNHVSIYNLVNLLVEATMTTGDMVGVFSGSDSNSAKEILKEEMTKILLAECTDIAKLTADFTSIISNTEAKPWGIREFAKEVIPQIEAMFGKVNIDINALQEKTLKKAIDLTDGALKTALKSALAEINAALVSWDIINDVCNFVNISMELKRSSSRKVIKFMVKEGDWKRVYAEFLNENLEWPAEQGYYGEGEGKFAIMHLDGDNIPELITIGVLGEGRILSCEKGKIKWVEFAEWTSDIPLFKYTDLYWDGNNGFREHITGVDYECWKYYLGTTSGEFSFVPAFEAVHNNGNYYITEYDINSMLNDEDYRYGVSGYGDISLSQKVTKEEYERFKKRHGFDESIDYVHIEQSDIHKITPDEIKKVLGY